MTPSRLFFFWGFGGLCTVLLISTSLLLLICLSRLFHQVGSCSLSDSGRVEAMGVACSPHRRLTNPHGCIIILASRHYPGMGTGEQTIRVHTGAEAEVPKQLFKASSWIHMAKGSECRINYDRPDIPPALHPQHL